jgi:hypothetical protein
MNFHKRWILRLRRSGSRSGAQQSREAHPRMRHQCSTRARRLGKRATATEKGERKKKREEN